ncbi:FliH/SctL family protein [Marinagarivorans algicola]|uniref:FliH/SctL family protein n=1 Tax=Marinagarivorans algicola TaxID=1513270 RepID=UPI0006B9DD0F|nr:FliH/SctL family protein [Marinagarivorans algicola]
MSTKMPGRIPFEQVASAQSWALPQVNGRAINQDEQRKRKTSESKRRLEQSQRTEKASPVVSEEIATPVEPLAARITAAQLQDITQAAEQDGYEKGYQEGLAEGKADGRKAGFSEGLKAGTEQAQSEHGQWLKEQGEHLGALCEALLSPLEYQQQALANATLDLALGVAKHILDTELSCDPTKIIAVVDAALIALPADEKTIQLTLHPDDADAYAQFGPPAAAGHTILTDESLSRGSCQVHSENSFVDFSVTARLAEFMQALQEHPFDDEAASAEVIEPARAVSPSANAAEAVELESESESESELKND